METCFKEIKSKENEINNRFEELDVKENELKLMAKELELRFIVSKNGKSLSTFLKEHENEHEKVEKVYDELRKSTDPAKLVVEAVKVIFSRIVNLGIEWTVLIRSCVLLLEQLMRVKPRIGKKVKKKAVTVAKRWKEKMNVGDEDDMEVLGFLMFLGAYGLVSEFNLIEVQCLFERVSKHKQASELDRTLGLVDKTPASIALDSNVKLQQLRLKNLHLDSPLPSQVKIEQDMVSSSVSLWPELESFCVSMDGRGLISFLCQKVKEHGSMRGALSDALELASEPAKLVLDVLPGFHRSNDCFKGLPLSNFRKSCILLLEQLMTISPQIEPYLNEEALKLAVDWKEKVAQMKYPTAVTVYGFLHFIVTYRLVSTFDAHELLGLLVRASEHKLSPNLCLALGLEDKIPILINNLLKNALMLEAIEYICAFELLHEFPPERILKGYLNYQKKRIYKGKNSNLPQKQAIDKEIATVRAVIKFVVDHRLESHCPPEKLESYIMELEKRKTGSDNAAQMEKKKADGKQTSASSVLYSDVKLQQFRLENLQLDNILPSQLKSEQDMVSSELKSFCISMDGRGLMSFLCQHVEEHHSMHSAISDALELASDPAKLVLDILPGFHRSNDYFKDFPLHNFRRSCILLLEQLMTAFPQIEPFVTEEALKLAIDWKERVTQKYPNAATVYGFLQFIVTYGLVASFDASELLSLLVRGSVHKQSPDLCLALGLADKIPILVENLLKNALMLEAIEYICAFELLNEFPPERILKGYLKYKKKRIYKGKKSNLPQNQAIENEIAVVRSVIKCITDHRLESRYPPEELENYIVELEKQKSGNNGAI